MPFFVVSWLAEELVEPDGDVAPLVEPDPLALWSDDPLLAPPVVLPEDAALEGALPDGEVLEPAPAVPEPDTEPDIEVPPAPEGEDDGAALEDEDAAPGAAGDDGAVVEPVADDELWPDGAVVVPREAVVLSARSHAARMLAPKATDTASARVESFMGPP
ncbi:MAG: hypothetical protein ACT4P4_11765 [Betaproteobacteria bacterium]